MQRFFSKFLSALSKPISIVAQDYKNLSLKNANQLFLIRLKSAYSHFVKPYLTVSNIRQTKLDALVERTLKLRSELRPTVNWSLIVESDGTDFEQLTELCQSVLVQMTEDDELLVGTSSVHANALKPIIIKIQADHPLKKIQLNVCETTSPVSNQLVERALNQRLLIIADQGWARPDLLYRFQQRLAFSASPSNEVLYCDEDMIDAQGRKIIGTHLKRPEKFEFPFIFGDYFQGCLSVSKSAWHSVGGLRNDHSYRIFDLCQRLSAAGFTISGIPLLLYSAASVKRAVIKNQFIANILNDNFKDFSNILTFKEETTSNGSAVRPAFKSNLLNGTVIIIPFHNEFTMTQKCVERLASFKNENNYYIVLVNNRSTPGPECEALKKLCDQWINADFAFNYSKINNFALSECKASTDQFPNVLFLNNDVILEPESLAEMANWLQIDRIGIVGARLFYPNGQIQHGGIAFSSQSNQDENFWLYVDHKKTRETAQLSQNLLITDAVTAACAMMRRTDFVSLKGFDEVQYPVAYSDTDLCLRIRKDLGKLCLMSPFAEGIHYESLSRGKNDLEDYEVSGWLLRSLSRALPSVTPRII